MVSSGTLYTFLHGERVENARPPHFLKVRSSNVFIIFTVSLAVFTDVFLYSVVVPVLPFALISRTNVEEADTQRWSAIFLSVYGAALGAGSLAFGYMADRTKSRRMPLLLGLFALAGATAMLCAGSGLAMLLAGRVLQGLSASVVWTVGLALLSDTVPKDEVGQAMGYVAMSYSVAALAGPLIGGVVYERAGYYAVFAVGFGFIGVDILLRLVMIERSTAEQWTLPNENSDSTELPAVQLSPHDQIQQNPIIEDTMSEKISAPVQSNANSTFIQRLPPIITLLGRPRLLTALFGCFIQSVSLASFDTVLPIFVKETFSWTSTGAGLIFLCIVVPALFSPLVGYISDRYGTRTITTAGFIGAVPAWVLLRFVTYNSLKQKVLLCALLTILGFCLTLVAAPLMAEIDHVLTVEERSRPGALGKRGAAAQGYGLLNFSFACGALIGPLWAGFVVESAGWATVGWSLSILSGVGALVTFVWTGGRIMLKTKTGETRG